MINESNAERLRALASQLSEPLAAARYVPDTQGRFLWPKTILIRFALEERAKRSSHATTNVLRKRYADRVKTISQRELRNDNARIMREIEAGAEFLVTRNGKAIAQVRPVTQHETWSPLPLARGAESRVDYTQLARVRSSSSTDSIVAELRDER